MASRLIATSSPDALDDRSVDALFVPRTIDVAPEVPAVLTALLVREDETVTRGQPLARVRRSSPAQPGAPLESVVTAPTAGFVVGCWAAVGEEVGNGRVVLSMTSADDVLAVWPRSARPCRTGAREREPVRDARDGT